MVQHGILGILLPATHCVTATLVPWSGHPSNHLCCHAPWICKGDTFSYDLQAVYQSTVCMPNPNAKSEQALIKQRGARSWGMLHL